jgi:hypothetical protein
VLVTPEHASRRTEGWKDQCAITDLGHRQHRQLRIWGCVLWKVEEAKGLKRRKKKSSVTFLRPPVVVVTGGTRHLRMHVDTCMEGSIGDMLPSQLVWSHTASSSDCDCPVARQKQLGVEVGLLAKRPATPQRPRPGGVTLEG